MNFKNLIILILLVTSCVKVGKDEESNYSRSSFNRLSVKFNDIKSDLIEKILPYWRSENGREANINSASTQTK